MHCRLSGFWFFRGPGFSWSRGCGQSSVYGYTIPHAASIFYGMQALLGEGYRIRTGLLVRRRANECTDIIIRLQSSPWRLWMDCINLSLEFESELTVASSDGVLYSSCI